MRRLLLIVIFIMPTLLFAQSKRNTFKYEWIFGVGTTNFLGALGGAPTIGTHMARDWQEVTTRPSFTGGMRYKINNHFSVKGAFTAAWVYANDAISSNPVRHDRNLNARSPIEELSVQGEYYPLKEKQGSLYRVKNSTEGKKKLDIKPYLFLGLGAFYFNPQGEWNGKWYNLRPLHTEGQGLPGGPKEYSQFAVSWPFGVGAKYDLNTIWSIGLELGLHYTDTPWIDDDHGVYYDNNAIKKAYGSLAAHFADPSLGTYWDGGRIEAGQERGDQKRTYTDAFILGIVNINYKILEHKRTRSKF
jgi:hypothetical protein